MLRATGPRAKAKVRLWRLYVAAALRPLTLSRVRYVVDFYNGLQEQSYYVSVQTPQVCFASMFMDVSGNSRKPSD